MNVVATRLLPLVGIAVIGVGALKVVGGVEGLSSLISPRANAEDAAGASHGALGKAPADPSTVPVQPPGALPNLPAPPPGAAPVGPAVCAPSAAELARQAGLSPGELQVIQTLGARRGQLDAREQALDTQLQLIAAAEQKVDGRIKAMNALKDEIQALAGQVDAQQQAEIDRLVVVYEKMKPKDAGPLMAALDDKVRIPVAAKMKPSTLAAILSQMGTAQAKTLSETLAKRFTPALSLAQALDGKTPPPVAAPAPEAKPAEAPKQVATAPAPKPKTRARPAAARPPAKLAKADAAGPVAKPAAEPNAVAASGATTPSKPASTAAAATSPPTKAAAAPAATPTAATKSGA